MLECILIYIEKVFGYYLLFSFLNIFRIIRRLIRKNKGLSCKLKIWN